MPSGLELLFSSILCWALPGIPKLVRSSSSSCGVSPQSSPSEMWKATPFSGSPRGGPKPACEPPQTSSFQGGEVILARTDPSLLACRSAACEHSIKAGFPIVKGQEIRAPRPSTSPAPPPASGTPEVPSELPQYSTSPTTLPLFYSIR